MNVRILRKIFSCTKGATALEYGLVAALIVVASMGAISAMSSTVVGSLNDTADKIVSATSNKK